MQQISRLIHSFSPDNYQLSLDIDRVQRQFHGQVTISGQAHDQCIRLHAKDLTIIKAHIDDEPVEPTRGDNDEIAFAIPKTIATTDHHTITIEYHGAITDSLHGLYPCYYQHDGVKKELLMTQFESHHAREMFPCVDEPEAKATFDVTVTTESGVTILGNMPIQNTQLAGDRQTVTFEQTPRMSTYLLALVIGDLQHKTAHTSNGTEVSVWATPAQSPASLDFALDHAVKSIEFFNDYFDTPYPLPKSDHVAVPDFSSGAMENWGLVTYRESALLADPATATIGDRQYIATVISHELSHQWFGNLVTMKWWNNLWLNESFANMMEYLAVDAIHPEWQMWDQFCNNEGVLALSRDAIDGVQPVQTDVHHPDEISTLFDGAIVYAKGGRLLYMMLRWIGEDAFRRGLKAYFTQHAYANAEGDDLWSALGTASGLDVAGLMNQWISTPGYPVVHIERHGTDVTLRQHRFFVGPHHSDDTLWCIPLHAASSHLPDTLDVAEVTLHDIPTDVNLQLNQHNVSHFITHYDDETLRQLIRRVADGTLSVADRSSLLNQQLLLTRSGVVSSASLVDLFVAYEHETHEEVWDEIARVIAYLRLFVEPDSTAERTLRRLAGQLATANFERLGWEAQPHESENDTKLRATIISHMIYSENEAVITEAKRRFAMQPFADIDSELRSIIASATVRHSDQPQPIIDTLLALYRETASPDLRQDITVAVTSTRQSACVDRLIALLTNTEVIRNQDTLFWFVDLLRNRFARDTTWHWLQDNWQWITQQYGSDKSFDYFPRYAGSILATREQLEEYRTFFTPLRDDPALTRVIDMGITDITARVELIERDTKAVHQALDKNMA